MAESNNFSSIIIEDEPLAVSLLYRYIDRYQGLKCQEIFNNAIAAKSYLDNNNPDIIFLDLHLPKLKGLDFLESLDREYTVIVTTAYSAYAIKGFEKGVVDYLLKPIEYARFEKAVNRACELILLKKEQNSAFIHVQENKSLVKVYLNNIVYVESDNGYAILHLLPGNLIRTKASITEFNSRLTNNFIRIHKSYIINLDLVKSISLGSVETVDGKSLNVGRKFRNHVKNVLTAGKL